MLDYNLLEIKFCLIKYFISHFLNYCLRMQVKISAWGHDLGQVVKNNSSIFIVSHIGWQFADDLCTPMVTWLSADTSDLQILGGGGGGIR